MNLLKMMKQAGSIQKDLKRVQKELESKTVEGSSGGVKVVARGDMSIDSIQIDLSMIDASKKEKLEKTVAAAVNDALSTAKKEAGREMSKLTGGMGLGDMGNMLG